MTEPEKPVEPEGVDDASSVAEEPVPPPPEPWTPERVLEWNRYYDLYIVAAILLLIFIGSAHPITSPSLWSDLQTGRLIRQRMQPVTTDPYSYTMAGRRWVNIPWLFQLASAGIHDAANGTDAAAAGQPALPGVNTLSRAKLATGLLVAVTALLRVAAAGLVLAIRRPGPGLWWAAVCALIALGAMLMPLPGGTTPLVPALGGIAMPAEVGPGSWGLFLMALELFILYRAALRGRPGMLWWLVPVFAIWANTDDSFIFGLIFLATGLLGMLVAPPRTEDGRRLSPAGALGVLAACAAVVLLNPSLARIYPVALSPLTRLFRSGATEGITVEQLSYFGRESQSYLDRLHGGEGTGAYRLYIAYYVVVVGLGLASFVMNRRRFSLGRFLTFAAAAALWAALAILAPIFALVWAVTMTLNGQEWYQDRFGRQGHLGAGWSLWSVGGRAVTLLAVSALLLKGLTGYNASPSEPRFGFGAETDEFAFEAADFIADAPFGGKVLNISPSTGDALIWKAWPRNPDRQTYIDGRPHLFPPSLRAELREIRRAFYAGEKSAWQPLLDRYGVTVVMVPAPPMTLDPNAPKVFESLSNSPDWIPFYDDGQVALFGRADAPETDLAFFRQRRLDAPQLAFHAERAIPSSDRTPTPTGPLDRFFQNRGRRNPQPHVWSAERWMNFRRPLGEERPDLAWCLLAIGELRTALAKNPDDPTAWRLLASAYAELDAREAEIFLESDASIAPPSNYVKFRLQQRLAVLNFAVMSTPPPRNQDARDALAGLHHQLGELYLSANAYDLARDHFEKQRKLVRPGDFSDEEASRLAQLDEQVERVQSALSEQAADPQQQINPMQRAEFAISQGAPGIAAQELYEADQSGLPQGQGMRARLLDLYCQVGWPDKAFELLGETGNIEDPSLYTGPGTASYRQGLVYFLIGSYDLAALMWRDRAIRQLRESQGMQAMEATRSFLRGLVRQSAEVIQELPQRVGTQSVWEAELGLCLLEAGKPAEAADRMAAALTLQPDSPSRPLLAHYLELLGHEVPPPPADSGSTPDGGSIPQPGPATELPQDVFPAVKEEAPANP